MTSVSTAPTGIACQNAANPPCSVRLRDYGAGDAALSAEDDGSQMSRRVFQLPGRARRDGQVPVAGALLTGQEQQLVEDELALLDRLSDALARYPAAEEDQGAVKRAAEHLIALFLLVIVGEFNAGKSAFINALVGAEVMPEGVTPTTSVINLLRFGPEPAVTMQADGVIVREYPAQVPRRDHDRRYAGHQRHHPGARAADAAVRAALRHGPLRHLRRPPVHRERAGIHGVDPRLGQEDRRRHQQGLICCATKRASPR